MDADVSGLVLLMLRFGRYHWLKTNSFSHEHFVKLIVLKNLDVFNADTNKLIGLLQGVRNKTSQNSERHWNWRVPETDTGRKCFFWKPILDTLISFCRRGIYILSPPETDNLHASDSKTRRCIWLIIWFKICFLSNLENISWISINVFKRLVLHS